MTVLTYHWSQCTTFHAAVWKCWFCLPFIWIRQRNTIKFCADLGKSAKETLAMIRQAFGEERMNRTGVARSSQGRPRKARHLKSKVKSMLIIFFNIKGIVHKEFVLAGQTVNSPYYCDVLNFIISIWIISLHVVIFTCCWVCCSRVRIVPCCDVKSICNTMLCLLPTAS
jgi:hypothetical protein